jgi:methyl-accepting chemotaxis protein
MNFFKQTTVGKKLVIGFSIMIFFMAAISLGGYLSVNNINRYLNTIFSINMPAIDYLIEADRDFQQLLVAERSMMFANVKSDTFVKLVEIYETNLAQAEKRWGKYKALDISAAEKALVPQFEKALAEWKAVSRKVVDGRKADTRQGRREALDLTLGIAQEKFEKMRDYIDQLTEISLGSAARAHRNSGKTYQNTIIVLSGASGLGLLMACFLIWVLSRGITRPLKAAINGLTQASDQVATGSNHVSASSQELAEGAANQAASIEETGASLEEISSMTRQNAANASEADGLMTEAMEVFSAANASMKKLTLSMEAISKASAETSKIIKTIDEIAFQTNLLALNAAVEAARAGEAGAGFAVVADEVRNLALRAAEAAKNTAELIDGSVQKISEGSELVGDTNDAFQNVAVSTSKVGGLIGEISAASNEQAQGIIQVNTAVNDMDKVVQKNAANAEESAAASEQMNAQAEQMRGIVNELAVLVGGIAKNHIARQSLMAPAKAAPLKKQMLANTRHSLPEPKGVQIDPEKAIPMDDDQDFQDF